MCKAVVMQNFNDSNNWYTPPNFHGFMSQVQSLQPSYLRSPELAQQEAKLSGKTKAKRERRTARQAKVLESSRCNQVWQKLVIKVCSLGPTKTL